MSCYWGEKLEMAKIFVLEDFPARTLLDSFHKRLLAENVTKSVIKQYVILC